jgi:hypothetical protein
MSSLPKSLSVDFFVASRVRSPDLLRLYKPEAAQHFVQFYEDDSFVIENVSYLAAKSLKAGDSSVLVATDSHLKAIEDRLASSGLNLNGLRESGRYVVVNAAQALLQFMVDGRPANAKFEEVIGGIIRRATKNSANGFAFAFGEMVAFFAQPIIPKQLCVWNGSGTLSLHDSTFLCTAHIR